MGWGCKAVQVVSGGPTSLQAGSDDLQKGRKSSPTTDQHRHACTQMYTQIDVHRTEQNTTTDICEPVESQSAAKGKLSPSKKNGYNMLISGVLRQNTHHANIAH